MPPGQGKGQATEQGQASKWAAWLWLLPLLLCLSARPGLAQTTCYQALAGGNLDQALEVCTQAMQAAPDGKTKAGLLNSRGLAWLAKGQLEMALADFSAAIELRPDYGLAYNNRAAAMARQGELSRAIADLDQALALMPGQAVLHVNRGRVHLLKGQLNPALADFNQALSLRPDYAPALYQRGLLWSQRGLPERAIADFSRILALAPDYAPALAQRGLSRGRKGEHGQAIADLDRALALHPGDVQALAGRALSHKKLGQYQQAVADYRRALELDPRHLPALNGLAWILATCPEQSWRDGLEAVALARRGVELRDDAGRLDTLAAALAEAGQFSQAAATQQKAISLIAPESVSRLKGEYEERLKAYRQGKPWREP